MSQTKITIEKLLEACRNGEKVLDIELGNETETCTYLNVSLKVPENGSILKSKNKFYATQANPIEIFRVREDIVKNSKPKYRASIKNSKNKLYIELLDYLNAEWADHVNELANQLREKWQDEDPNNSKIPNSDYNRLVCREFKIAPKGSTKKTELKVLDDPQGQIMFDTAPDNYSFVKSRKGKMKSRFHIVDVENPDVHKVVLVSERKPNTPDLAIPGGTKYWGELTFSGSNFTVSYGFRLKVSFGWGHVILGEGDENEFASYEDGEESEFITNDVSNEETNQDDLPQTTRGRGRTNAPVDNRRSNNNVSNSYDNAVATNNRRPTGNGRPSNGNQVPPSNRGRQQAPPVDDQYDEEEQYEEEPPVQQKAPVRQQRPTNNRAPANTGSQISRPGRPQQQARPPVRQQQQYDDNDDNEDYEDVVNNQVEDEPEETYTQLPPRRSRR